MWMSNYFGSKRPKLLEKRGRSKCFGKMLRSAFIAIFHIRKWLKVCDANLILSDDNDRGCAAVGINFSSGVL